MKIVICLLDHLKSSDVLTYTGLVLAYIAYVWSVNRDFQSWKSLFISFHNDLVSHKAWLGREYFSDAYNDKDSFNPYKIIYPLSFESLPEIIRRGVAELPWISDKFINQLSIFNERISAFNSFLDQIKKSNSASPVLTEKLKDKLKELGLDDENIEFNEFKKKIFEQKNSEEILYLAENNRRLNRALHVKLIGNKNDEDKLHYLYSEIRKELENILGNFDIWKPWFIKLKVLIIVISIILFFLIEIVLK